jgi:ABC-2 type transport system ATP-binding protein
MIEVENLKKSYGKTEAVNDLNLSVEKGELFGFIGPNGAGKTTTIKMLGGLISPDAGSVRICGIDMIGEPERAKRKIGFIPDRPYLYEKLTGMEFLKFTADIYGMDGDFYRRADEELERFSLSDWGDELIESYSHGMKQRLIMAAALLHDPEAIVVDEPMVGLDPAAISMVKKLFRQLVSRGVTIFMSTHTLSVAEDICDRIGVIRNGALIAVGTAAELKKTAEGEDGGISSDLEQVFMRLTQ